MIFGAPLKDQFEELLEKEEAKTVEPQITDAVTVAKPKKVAKKSTPKTKKKQSK